MTDPKVGTPEHYQAALREMTPSSLITEHERVSVQENTHLLNGHANWQASLDAKSAVAAELFRRITSTVSWTTPLDPYDGGLGSQAAGRFAPEPS